MQCTSNIPVYNHANVGAGFAWHLYNGDANYGEERGYDLFVPPCAMDKYLGYDKEVLRSVMQNHEATFRYQVQELHRLYRRQRELMDKIRMGENFLHSPASESNRCLFHMSEKTPHTTSWMFGDCSDNNLSVLNPENILRPPTLFAKNFQDPGYSLGKDIYNEVKTLPSKSKGHEKRIFDLELPADVYNDDEEAELLQEGNVFTYNTPTELPNTWPASDLQLGSVRKAEFASFNTSSRKRKFLFDLNEPIQIEDQDYENVDKAFAWDCNSASDHVLRKGKFGKDDPVVDAGINDKFMEISKIDLNTSVYVDETVIPMTATNVETDLEAPVSPENKEGSPPRGKSKDIKLETPLILSEQGRQEFDSIAAETLIMISSSGVQEFPKAASPEPLGNLFSRLSLFAEIVSSIGDNLENEVTKIPNIATDNNEGGIVSDQIDDFRRKVKEPRTRKSFQADVVACTTSPSRDIHSMEACNSHNTGLSRKKTGRYSCAKPRKYSKLSSSGNVKKSKSSSLKLPAATCMKQSVLKGWGKIEKRRGGVRRPRACKLALFIAHGK